MSRTTFFRSFALLSCCVLLWPAGRADAQGVTTGAITGVVKDAQGAVIPGATVTRRAPAVGQHIRSVTQADGRFIMPGMRVGGPYTVTASLPGFTSEAKNNITVSLGVTQDLDFSAQGRQRLGDDHGRRPERPGVQLGAHRRGHRGDARGSRDAADDFAAASPTSRA